MNPLLFVVHLGGPRPASLGTRRLDHDARAPIPDAEPANEPFPELLAVERVTATALFVAFAENAARAERDFCDRVLGVAGAVERVAREGDRLVVHLSVSGRPGASVPCLPLRGPRHEPALAALLPGDLALVVGRRIVATPSGVVVKDALVLDGNLAGVGVLR
jgi:hypothetical protein